MSLYTQFQKELNFIFIPFLPHWGNAGWKFWIICSFLSFFNLPINFIFFFNFLSIYLFACFRYLSFLRIEFCESIRCVFPNRNRSVFNVDYQILHTFIRFNSFNYLSLSHFLFSFLLIHPPRLLLFFPYTRPSSSLSLLVSLSPCLCLGLCLSICLFLSLWPSLSVSPCFYIALTLCFSFSFSLSPSLSFSLSLSLCFFLIVLFVFSDPGSRELVWATSWGVSTRLIGAMVMSHSDDKGTYIRILYLQMHFKYLFFLPKVSSSLFF